MIQTLANTPRDWSKPGAPQTWGTQYQTARDTDLIPRQAGPMQSAGYQAYLSGQRPAATPAQGPTATPPVSGGPFNISTGITVGPVLPQGIVQSETDRLRNYQAPAGSPFLSRLNQILSPQMNQMATDFNRDATFANAQHQLATEQARAGATRGWGNLALGDYSAGLGNQMQMIQAILSLLGQLG